MNISVSFHIKIFMAQPYTHRHRMQYISQLILDLMLGCQSFLQEAFNITYLIIFLSRISISSNLRVYSDKENCIKNKEMHSIFWAFYLLYSDSTCQNIIKMKKKKKPKKPERNIKSSLLEDRRKNEVIYMALGEYSRCQFLQP